MTGKTTNEFSPEVRARALQMGLDHAAEQPPRWQAIVSIATKIGCSAHSLNDWAKKAHPATPIDDRLDGWREIPRPLHFIDDLRRISGLGHENVQLTDRINLDRLKRVCVIERDELAYVQEIAHQGRLAGLTGTDDVDETSGPNGFHERWPRDRTRGTLFPSVGRSRPLSLRPNSRPASDQLRNRDRSKSALGTRPNSWPEADHARNVDPE